MHELRGKTHATLEGACFAGALFAWVGSIWVTIQTNLGRNALILEKFRELTQSGVKCGQQDPLD